LQFLSRLKQSDSSTANYEKNTYNLNHASGGRGISCFVRQQEGNNDHHRLFEHRVRLNDQKIVQRQEVLFFHHEEEHDQKELRDGGIAITVRIGFA
jgi:hypothetical protein